MTSEAFNNGFQALAATFPNMNLNARLFWAMLNDLDGEFFLKAVWEMIKTTKELYPGTNVIALLREKAVDIQAKEKSKEVLRIAVETETERIERWKKEAVPMPDECRVALDKLGIALPFQK